MPDGLPDDVAIISNIVDAGGKPIGALGDGEAFWHTDSSFTETPISASLLHAIEVTEEGGETGFLNMYRAYEDMPTGLAARINGKYVNHSKVHNSAGMRRPEFAEVTDPSKAPGVKHPIVRTHPRTGRKILYISRHVSHIAAMKRATSDALLEALMRRPGVVVSKLELLDEVWGPDFTGDPNIVEVYVGYLRRKIDAPFGTISIETLRGVGYRMAEPG